MMLSYTVDTLGWLQVLKTHQTKSGLLFKKIISEDQHDSSKEGKNKKILCARLSGFATFCIKLCMLFHASTDQIQVTMVSQ